MSGLPLRMNGRQRVSTAPDVELLRDEICRLVGERQRLREHGAGPLELERNRMLLARTQQQLGHALIRRHLPAAAAS